VKPLLWMDENTLRVLEPEFSKGLWCLFAYDTAASWSAAITRRVCDFASRYADLPIRFGLVLPLPPGQIELRPPQLEWISRSHFPHVVAGDPGSSIRRGLGFSEQPMGFRVFRAGKFELSWDYAVEAFPKFEQRFQQWLRSSDPGLPLIDPREDDIWPELR
jgi:hypothetical protein